MPPEDGSIKHKEPPTNNTEEPPRNKNEDRQEKKTERRRPVRKPRPPRKKRPLNPEGSQEEKSQTVDKPEKEVKKAVPAKPKIKQPKLNEDDYAGTALTTNTSTASILSESMKSSDSQHDN